MPRLQKGISSADNGELFDDCPICRAMKTAAERGRDLTSEELREAFKQAKDEGGVVGGKLFK